MIKTTALLIFFLFSANFIFGQSNYSKGFEIGYKAGYCHDEGVGCISPTPPISSIPKIGQSLDNYQDGYNSGFKMGLIDRIKDENDGSRISSKNRTRYKSPKPEFVEDFMYKLPVEQIMKLLEQKKAENYTGDYQSTKRQTTSKYIYYNPERSLYIGLKAGALLNKNLFSPTVGLYFQGNISENFGILGEIYYYQLKPDENFSSSVDTKNRNILQVGLSLKHKLVEKFDLLYGVAYSAATSDEFQTINLNLGGQYYLNENLIVDGRFIYQVYNQQLPNSSGNDSYSKANFMVTLNYHFKVF